MKYLFPILLVCFFSSTPLFSIAQKGKPHLSLSKISRPEKCWAIGHPFIAKKTFRLTGEALLVADSIHEFGILRGSMSGGQPDAFKHAYWMALLSQKISTRKARKLGKAHEKGNYLTYKKAKRKGLVDSHNLLASEMDLWNNDKGIEIGGYNKNISAIQLQQIVIDSIKSGAMRIIKKDSLGGTNILVPSDHISSW
jgi:hypothetical protein